MNKGTVALIIGVSLLFIAYDVGSGALQGIAAVDRRRQGDASISELVRRAVSARENEFGAPWTKFANIRSVSAIDDGILLHLDISEQSKVSIGSRITKAKEVDIRHDLQDEICKHKDLKYLLLRGGDIVISLIDRGGRRVLFAKTQHDYC